MIKINKDRLIKYIHMLGACGAREDGGVCRLALTKEDKEGRDLVVNWMKALGLDISIDRLGNVTGTRKGKRKLSPVMMGSHIDTVRTGGLYDGNLGVLAGLEVIKILNEAQQETERPIAVTFFTNEEGARFTPDMMGSLVYAGGMAVEDARAVTDETGMSVGACLDRIGYTGTTAVEPPDIHAFLELHIEQGPVLERKNIQIGAVEKVQGISWNEFIFEGVSNHAGTTPMSLRKDAGYAAMCVGHFIRQMAGEIGGDQVATIGSFELYPNIVNVVPNKARFVVDLRNTDNVQLALAEKKLHNYVQEIVTQEGLNASSRQLVRFDPVDFDQTLVQKVEEMAQRFGKSVLKMPSGAGHDAQMMARICPTAMIFVPSQGGISHNIHEYTSPEDIEAGANILLNMVYELAMEEE